MIKSLKFSPVTTHVLKHSRYTTINIPRYKLPYDRIVSLTPPLIVFIQVLRSTAANGTLHDVVQGVL
jgi:hypothetical protein